MSELERVTQLREHNVYEHILPEYIPDIRFIKPDGTTLRIDSYIAGPSSMGHGHCFIVFRRSWLHGKTVKIRWRGYTSYTGPPLGYALITIIDGAYDRRSFTDFPDKYPMVIKGNGQLYYYEKRSPGGFPWEEHTFTADLSGGIMDYVTLFVVLVDARKYHTIYVDIDYIRVYDGDTLVFSQEFTENVIMEVTGTHNDYGYIGPPIVPPVYRPEFTLSWKNISSMVKPEEGGGYWILGYWVRKVRARYDKILADDHNIPRLVLIKVKDLLGEAQT